MFDIKTKVSARLRGEDVANVLGFAEHDVPVLVSKRLLKTLGKRVQSATKYFAACEIEKLANDPSWLNKATQAIYDYWKDKNARKSQNSKTDLSDSPESENRTADSTSSLSE